jgi:chromosome segregation ATPase
MAFLENEKARAQAEIQRSQADITGLTGQIEILRQTHAGANAEAEAARGTLAERQAQRPALEAAVTSKERRVADLDRQIDEHQQTEPVKEIERPNKPPLPNPEWKTWKNRLDDLVESRGRAQADVAAARVPLDQLNAAVAQLTTAIQAATNRASQAEAALNQLEETLGHARTRLLADRQALADLTRWTDEVDRQSMDRPALELVAAALSARAQDFAEAYAAARTVSRKADETLSSLTGRRDRLAAELADVNSQLPAAEDAVTGADAAVADLEQQMADHLGG